MNTKIIGNEGEDIASSYIEAQDIKIIAKNFSCRYGEIDLIGIRSNTVYFYEVKYRNNFHFGYGEESISKSKIRKLRQSIEIWVSKNRQYLEYNKYLNAIIISPDKEILELEIL